MMFVDVVGTSTHFVRLKEYLSTMTFPCIDILTKYVMETIDYNIQIKSFLVITN